MQGWSGAVVGVGMLRGENKKGLRFIGFVVSWFLGFNISWFRNLLVSKGSWFLGFEISKFQRFSDPVLPIFDFMSLDGY